MFKESSDYTMQERADLMNNAEILKEFEIEGKEKTPLPYDLNKPYQVGIYIGMIANTKETYNNFFEAIESGHFQALIEDKEILLDGVPLPREFFGDTLVHVMTLENWQILEDDDYIGDNKKNGAVYLQVTDSNVLPNHDNFAPGKVSVRLFVDTDTLFEQNRKIFLDGESVDDFPEEYKKSFFMYGGIPRSAIKKVQIIKINSEKIPDTTDYGEYDRGKEKQMDKEYNRRLASVEDRLKNMRDK